LFFFFSGLSSSFRFRPFVKRKTLEIFSLLARRDLNSTE